MENENECDSIFEMLPRTSSWNSRAKFHIVISNALAESWVKFVIHVFERFWNYYVFNITIVVFINGLVSHSKVSAHRSFDS